MVGRGYEFHKYICKWHYFSVENQHPVDAPRMEQRKNSVVKFDNITRYLGCNPQVIVVEGLERFNDLWGYVVEPLMPDRYRVRFQVKRDMGFTPCAGGRGSLPRRVCSSDVTAQVNQ